MRALYERRKVEIIEILNSDQMRILDKIMKCLEKGPLEKTRMCRRNEDVKLPEG